MHVAFHLATHASDPFVARTLSRHILVRAENFIEHARGLRKPLKNAGYDTRNFHKKKEDYASVFVEYFKVSRDRLGAHVQDFDFGKRIELWNDIEIVKIGFFVEGAREVYESLTALNLPGFASYTSPPELADPSVVEALHQYQRTNDQTNWVEMGVDSLAMTRNNTTAALNTTPVHARAAQLALIRRWVTMQRNLLAKFVAHPSIVRILRARIVTDIVSFCDCLVTRPVPAGAPQEMDGLNQLVRASGQSSASIDDFVAASNFQTELQTARNVRDVIGAHLEIDDTYTVPSLIADLDAYDLSQGLSFYERVSASFMKACRSILFLRTYAADGQRIYGVTAGGGQSVPFAGDNVIIQPPQELPPINDEEAYRKNLVRWLDGDDAQRGDSRQFFWNAFQGSQSMETIDEVEHFGTGHRLSKHEFRKAHQFLVATLSEQLSDSDFRGILELILSCRSGWPYPLAEILVRYGEGAPVPRRLLVCHVLGEIGSAPHESVVNFLAECAGSKGRPIRLDATLARYKTFVKTEGIHRVNHRGHVKVEYGPFVDSLITSMSSSQLFICLLAFASILSGPGIGSLSSPFKDNYAHLQRQIQSLCLPYLKDDDNKSKTTTLKNLVDTHDYVGVCVLVALDLDGGDQNPLYNALIDSCCSGSIVAAGHAQATRHLAMCFLLKKEHRIAFEIADGLASSHPDWVDIQVLAAEILGETRGAEEDAVQRVSTIRKAYKLTAELEARLSVVETEIAQRKT
jgi:hypothetical protein